MFIVIQFVMTILFTFSIFMYTNNPVVADINKLRKVYRESGFNEIRQDIQNVEKKIVAKNISVSDFHNICLFYKQAKDSLGQIHINSNIVKDYNNKLINSANSVVEQCLSNDANQITQALLNTMSQQKTIFDEMSKKSDENKVFSLLNNWSKLVLAVIVLNLFSITYLLFCKPLGWLKSVMIEVVFLSLMLIFIISPQVVLQFLI